MVFKSRTIIKIITFLIISGAILDESQAIKKSTWEGPSTSPLASAVEDKQYSKFRALYECPPGKDCDNNLTTECRTQIVDAIFQQIDVPLDDKVSGYCCYDLLHNIDEHCFFDVMVKDLQKQDPCKKDPRELKARADQVWYYCIGLA